MSNETKPIKKTSYTDLEWPISEIQILTQILFEYTDTSSPEDVAKAGVIARVLKEKTDSLKGVWTEAFDNHGYLKEVS